jgi:heat shock protein HtpX
MFRRIILFVLTNLAIMFMISLILQVFHVQPYLTARGIDYTSLMIFCAVWGFGGAFISLALSRVIAKWSMRVQVIDQQSATGPERELVEIVRKLATGAKLPAMPQVGIYDSPELNAFATGPTRSRALVAVSSGLLRRMSRPEIEGVLGHEIAHVANGDMVTMTLLQGVVNAFVMFLARVLAFAISQAMRGDRDDRGGSYMVQYLMISVFQLVFGLIGMMVVAYFSRQREFRADKGGAELAGREKMIGALEALGRSVAVEAPAAAVATLQINNTHKGGLARFFMTHPDLSVRIERLRQYA